MATRLISRMSGAGNTFLVWNATSENVPKESRAGIVRLLCDSFTGFYTDGMIFIEKDPSGQNDFVWDFYNSDGSNAEMCGNAARCAALYYKHRLGGSDKVKFQTRAGQIIAEVLDFQIVEVQMPKLKEPGKFVEIADGKKKTEYFFVNTGVPHLVVEGEPDQELAEKLRHAPELGDAGANVTFVNEVTPGEMEAVTFERGVENFTLACGTGAVAAAAFSLLKNPLLRQHAVEMPGGSLRVEWKSDTQAVLSGPTQFEFDLQFPEDNL
ncbi:MAG: diaminopimelate epimerase [Bdellovibrionaceae bacterium]|nr:diaminopimelate epimerase [Pseudobdellovibrionaceae bacterium]